MKKDRRAHASIASHPPLVLGQRLISAAERRFLEHYNRIRLLKLTGFWCRVLFFVLLFMGLYGVIAGWAMKTHDARIALLLPVVALANALVLFQWGRAVLATLRQRWWLPIDGDTKILRLRGTLALRIHPGMTSRPQWQIGNADLELPAHWGDPLLAREGLRENAREVELYAALLPADPSVPHPHYRHSEDAHYFAVAYERFSLAREQAAAIPGLRAHDLWYSLGLWLILLAGLSGIGGYAMYARQQQDQQTVQGQLAPVQTASDELRQRLGSARGLESDVLQARGFASLQPHTLAGIAVLSGPPIDYLAVARGHDDPVLVLRPPEYRLLLRAVQVFPQVLPGEGSLAPELLRTYRRRVARAIITADQPRDLRARMLTRLEQLPDLLLEQQMRSFANRARVHPEFLAHLLPQPMVLLYREDPVVLPADGPPAAGENPIHCTNHSPLCTYDSPQPQVRTLREPVFTRVEEHIQMIPAQYFATLEQEDREISALRQQLREVHARPWSVILFALAGIAALLALLIIRSFLHARRQVNHFYR